MVIEHHQTVKRPRKGTPGWLTTLLCTPTNREYYMPARGYEFYLRGRPKFHAGYSFMPFDGDRTCKCSSAECPSDLFVFLIPIAPKPGCLFDETTRPHTDSSVSLGFLRENPQRNGHVFFSPSCCFRQFRNFASVKGRTKKRVFAQSKIPYYSSHSAVFNIELIYFHGDILPHPGPNRASYRNHDSNVAYGNRHRKSDISRSIFYTKSRSLVNKTALLELEIATYRYDTILWFSRKPIWTAQ